MDQNGTFYHNVLLTRHRLPVACANSGEFFIFRQDNHFVNVESGTVLLC